ncbi:hypothetical protein BC835DRAFT_32067 [Cytidiella melzeri]|nr:hypothetical protein BC835DRAFT_32067 [Cytidiella melzeri]
MRPRVKLKQKVTYSRDSKSVKRRLRNVSRTIGFSARSVTLRTTKVNEVASMPAFPQFGRKHLQAEGRVILVLSLFLYMADSHDGQYEWTAELVVHSAGSSIRGARLPGSSNTTCGTNRVNLELLSFHARKASDTQPASGSCTKRNVRIGCSICALISKKSKIAGPSWCCWS